MDITGYYSQTTLSINCLRIGIMNLKGSLPLLILHILSFGPNHGYQIGKLIYQWSGNKLEFREGTLYPALHQLEDQGMIALMQEKTTSGRRTRRYRLTDLGQEQLELNLEEWEAFSQAVNNVLNTIPENDHHT